MLSKNSLYDIEITDLTDEGMGIGRAEGIAVFTPGLLPGEKARVRIVKTAKTYAYGRLEKLLEKSMDRREAICPAFKSCGGCSVLNLEYSAQLALKAKRVEDCLKRIGGCDAEVLPVLASPKELRYRNKMAFPVSGEGGKVQIGCYRRGSHSVVDTEGCYLQSAKAERSIGVLRNWILRSGNSVYDENTKKGKIRYFVVRENYKGELMCAIISTGRLSNTDGLVRGLVNCGAVSVIENINKAPGNFMLGRESHILFGKDTIEEEILGLKFDISLHSFLQVNHDATELLYSTAIGFADLKEGEVLADLYCGAGTIGLLAAEKAGRLYGIEIVPEAIENARNNAKKNGITNASFLCADCDEGFAKISAEAGKIDVVIVDPPRKGLAQGVISSIADCGAERIVYVSCDPATLARDIALFREKGFEVLKVQPVDMFPQTMHVETVVLLSKLNTKQHIEIKVDMDELDLTSAEQKASYGEIKEYVLAQIGLNVSSLYIAQVKQKYGIIERENYNKPKNEDTKQPQCPPEKEKAIVEALKHFKMIGDAE